MDKITWLEIMLAFTGVALMGITAIVALVAIYGFFAIRNYVRNTAQQIAKAAINDFINYEKGNIRRMIEAVAKGEGNEVFEDLAMVKSFIPDAKQSNKHKENNNE